MSEFEQSVNHVSQRNTNDNGEMVQQVLPLALIRGEAVLEQPKDLFIPPDALEVILESFEGPLDLLLYLIKKQKFDILDLPILPITTQYMQYVELMKDVKLELAAEYLVMAAILAEIKSRLLLPKQTVDQEEVDPRAELVRRLQEYEVMKQAAQDIHALPQLDRDTHMANALMPDLTELAPMIQVDMDDLLSALKAVIKRSAAFEHHHIKREFLSTRERMSAIMNRLHGLPETSFIAFSELFNLKEGKAGIVVTFLAMLELIKESFIECVQAHLHGEIQIRLKP